MQAKENLLLMKYPFKIWRILLLFIIAFLLNFQQVLQSQPLPEADATSIKHQQNEQIQVLILTERGGQHEGFVVAALEWIDEFKTTNNLTITEINDASVISEHFLKNYNLIIQLDYPPYTWPDSSANAFIDYIEKGNGGWVGFHHATLLGEFDGYPMWEWFSDFMGGIRFKNYIAPLASGTVYIENTKHPVMKGVSKSFKLPKDEWYTFVKSPRPNINVLANVDESSYNPPSDIKMGDHPVIWVNEKKKARNIYFLMGHHSELFESENFVKMFGNAITWASE